MSTPLLERSGELAAIGISIEAAQAGAGRLVLIEGEAGIGKTRLVDEACAAGGQAGCRVLRARGAVLEEQFAFGAVRQLFEGLLVRASRTQQRAWLGGAAALAGPLLGVGSEEESRPVADAMFAGLLGLYWLCFNLAAQQPLLIALDDAHWADTASLRFVHFLASRLDGLRLTMVLALRPNERGVRRDLLEHVRAHPAAEVITPSELSEQACGRLLGEVFDEPERPFLRACFEATGGNPFYLRALADALVSDGIAPQAGNAVLAAARAPSTVVRSLVLRLGRLPPAATALARALAVLGTDADLLHAAALAGLEPADAAEAADRLRAAAILKPGRGLRFVHPIVEAAIYSDLSTAERDQMHVHAARILNASRELAERAASHLLASEPRGDPESVEVLRAAARTALGRGASESAVSLLERARREGASADVTARVLRELGVAEFLLGQEAGLEHLREALDRTRDVRERAEIAAELGNALTVADRFQEAVRVVEEAIAELGDGDPPLTRGLEAQLLGAAGLHLATRPAHRRHVSRLRATLRGDAGDERALLANVALWATSEGEPADAVRALAERALGNGELLEEVTSDSQMFYAAANALIYCEAFDSARGWFDRALADARARGSRTGFAMASAMRSECCYYIGELAEAEADARAAIDAGDRERLVLDPVAVWALVHVLVERGELDEAEALLADLEARVGLDRHRLSDWLLDQSGMINWLVHARGHLELSAGRWEDAAGSFLAVGEWMGAWGERNPGLLDWRTGAALALSRLGDLERARGLSDEVIALGRSLGQSRAVGAGLRAAAAVEGGAESIELLREAARAFASAGARLEQARTLIDLGGALRRAKHRREARDPLREGIDLAQRCGATALAERGRVELVAAGARPRRRTSRGVEALTPSELRVVQLAAGGSSNPEIAQRLFVTINTVESHLRRAYLKLDIHSRQALPEALASAEPPQKFTTAP